MYSLHQSIRARGNAGIPLPFGFKAFEKTGICLRTGQMSVWAGPGGTGKSTLMMNYIIRGRIPSLYMSADSDAFVQLSRAIAITKGWTFPQAMTAVLENRQDEFLEVLTGLPFRFDYHPNPTYDMIEENVRAYAQMYGEYPHLIVADNVTNVVAEDDDDKLQGLIVYLHSMARRTGSHVAGMHHVTGMYNNGDKPIPLDGVKGQITGEPEAVYTLHRRGGDQWTVPRVGVSPVKQRVGVSDTSGNTFASLVFHADKALMTDEDES